MFGNTTKAHAFWQVNHMMRLRTRFGFQCPHRRPPALLSLSITLRRKPPKPRYLGPSDNGGGGGSYAIIKGDISTLYKDMSYLKSCKLTSPPLYLCALWLSSPSPSLLARATRLFSSSLITLITTRNWKEDSFVKKGWVCEGGRREGGREGTTTNGAPKAVSAIAAAPPRQPMGAADTWRARGGRPG